jgi:hypothetical protein
MSLTEYSPGDVLTASSLNANLAFAASSSNTNVVINGAMQVAQRGTSTASITAGGYYTADRWRLGISSIGTWTQSLENDAPTGSGFRKSVKMLCTTADASPAASDTVGLAQRIEGQNLQQFLKGTSSAKQFSLSFWVKSNVTGTYIAELLDVDNSRRVSASYSVSASATWEKKTITFPADTTGAFDNDNAVSLEVFFHLGAGTNITSGSPLQTTWGTGTTTRATGQTNLAAATSNYWQITGVQLEAGSVATPFEFENFGVTLAKCQRYYYVIPRTAEGFSDILSGGTVDQTTFARYGVYRPVMRTESYTLFSSAANLFANLNASGNQAGTTISFTNGMINLNSASLSTGQSTVFRANDSGTAFIALSTEL